MKVNNCIGKHKVQKNIPHIHIIFQLIKANSKDYTINRRI